MLLNFSFASYSPFVKLKNELPSIDFNEIPIINSKQWYIYNTKNTGFDLNVLDVWKMGITGKGVVIALIDDGVDFSHPDLSGKFVSLII